MTVATTQVFALTIYRDKNSTTLRVSPFWSHSRIYRCPSKTKQNKRIEKQRSKEQIFH